MDNWYIYLEDITNMRMHMIEVVPEFTSDKG